jgi:DNA (cytosine-5)-methyltransferase 1
MGGEKMRYLDVCAGISAPTVAWKPLGWQALAYAEIADAPRAVLAHHYPDVPLVGDFTTIRGDEYGPVDLLVGGTPCQSFSVAGLRGGLADDRGNLALEYLRLADRARPRWLVWENVPGVLSSNGGRDFGAILGGMVELGYGVAYRVLDAQFAGVPQRRRRVFVVGYLGDWRRAAAVLFEQHSLQGHSAPRRQAGPSVADLTANGVGTCGADDNQGQAGHLIASTGSTAHCLNAGGMGRQDYETETLIAHSLRGEGLDASEDGTGRGTPLVPVCFSAKDHGGDAMEDCSPTLRAGGHSGSHANAGVMPAFHMGSAVRRLTPVECLRLQGFPDDYFDGVMLRGKPLADGPKYKMLGNSMAVPCISWIGERIDAVESLSERTAA